MELFNIIAGSIGWPAIVAILLVACGYGLWVLHKQSIILNERIQFCKEQLAAEKENSPDVLAKRLSSRVHLLKEELASLNADQEASQESIRDKEAELSSVKNEINNLKRQLAAAADLLRVVSEAQLVCPNCGAVQEVREYHSELCENNGHELEIDHETIRYACGFEVIDGIITNRCHKRDRRA